MRYLLAIGGVTIAINVDSNADARTIAPLGGPISRFVVAGEAPVDIDVRVRLMESAERSAQSAVVFDSGSLWRMYADGRIEFRSSFSGDEPYKIARVS
ncbi:MAG TPA: hypothetical protein VGR95_21900, partial [Thermoanaerobaculia bacterium]|nr:hypothetical protein [Thermoanaerobaculia bacterium]